MKKKNKLMDKESKTAETAWISEKLDPPGACMTPSRTRVDYKSGRRKWKSILGGVKQRVGVERRRASASFSGQSSCA